jgi:hypothetical protein
MPTLDWQWAGIRQAAANRAARRAAWRSEGIRLWERWRDDPFFTFGIALYWGEGTKSPRGRYSPSLALTNSDPALLRVWLTWCRRYFPERPIKYSLHLHDTADADAACAFWQRELGITNISVRRAVSRASARHRQTLPNGTLRVRIGRGSVECFTKMHVWLELSQQL